MHPATRPLPIATSPPPRGPRNEHVAVDATGRVLEAPVPLPGVQSPQHPYLADAPTLPGSRGFESMALSVDGKTLYPVLEGALTTAPDPRRRPVREVDLRRVGADGFLEKRLVLDAAR